MNKATSILLLAMMFGLVSCGTTKTTHNGGENNTTTQNPHEKHAGSKGKTKIAHFSNHERIR